MSGALNELYQKAVLDHSRSPRNFRALPQANRSGQGHNPLCGDRFTVSLQVEGELILDIAFQGSGCAISKASASMLTETLKGKSIGNARHLSKIYEQMVKTGSPAPAEMGDLVNLAGLHKFPMRVKCALLPWEALGFALSELGLVRSP